jgi:hypothetical protein
VVRFENRSGRAGTRRSFFSLINFVPESSFPLFIFTETSWAGPLC